MLAYVTMMKGCDLQVMYISIIKRVAGTFFFELRDSPISITRTEIMFDYRFEGRTGKELSYQ
jgi:hypothetical protein